MKVQTSISPSLKALTAKDVLVGRFFRFNTEYIYLRVSNGCVRFRNVTDSGPVYLPEEVIGMSQWKNPTVEAEDFSLILGGK